ncbi:MAG: hypothetical protein AAF348_19450, partial [Bacteroidota bacterium]
QFLDAKITFVIYIWTFVDYFFDELHFVLTIVKNLPDLRDFCLSFLGPGQGFRKFGMEFQVNSLGGRLRIADYSFLVIRFLTHCREVMTI